MRDITAIPTAELIEDVQDLYGELRLAVGRDAERIAATIQAIEAELQERGRDIPK